MCKDDTSSLTVARVIPGTGLAAVHFAQEAGLPVPSRILHAVVRGGDSLGETMTSVTQARDDRANVSHVGPVSRFSAAGELDFAMPPLRRVLAACTDVASVHPEYSGLSTAGARATKQTCPSHNLKLHDRPLSHVAELSYRSQDLSMTGGLECRGTTERFSESGDLCQRRCDNDREDTGSDGGILRRLRIEPVNDTCQAGTLDLAQTLIAGVGPAPESFFYQLEEAVVQCWHGAQGGIEAAGATVNTALDYIFGPAPVFGESRRLPTAARRSHRHDFARLHWSSVPRTSASCTNPPACCLGCGAGFGDVAVDAAVGSSPSSQATRVTSCRSWKVSRLRLSPDTSMTTAPWR